MNDKDDEDALTYATDQSYCTPPQEEAVVLHPIEVGETSTCTCPPSVPIASDPIEILDTKEEEDKENNIHVLEMPSLIFSLRTMEDAVHFQRAICSGYRKPDRSRLYPAITFPWLAYPGLSLQAEIHSSFQKVCGVGKIASINNQRESGYDGGHSGGDDGEDGDSESVRDSGSPSVADFDRA